MMHFKSLARSPEVFLCQHFLFLAVFILLQEGFEALSKSLSKRRISQARYI